MCHKLWKYEYRLVKIEGFPALVANNKTIDADFHSKDLSVML